MKTNLEYDTSISCFLAAISLSLYNVDIWKVLKIYTGLDKFMSQPSTIFVKLRWKTKNLWGKNKMYQ